MPDRHKHRSGRHLVTDEESGIVVYDDQIAKRWDGALVRRKAYETRQPQEFVRAKNDPRALKDVRPAQEASAVSLGSPFFVGNTQVPTKQGMGYRLSIAGIGKMRIAESFQVQGEVDDISVTAAPLKFDPSAVVPLTNPVSYNITTTTTATRTIHLADNEHAIVQIASGRSEVNGMCRIIGGGTDSRVWVIGGRINNNYSLGGSGTDHKCLDISDVRYAYIEGLRLDKGTSLGDALTVRGSAQVGPTAYVQNCLLIGGQTSAATLHGDCLQAQSQIRGLHLYNVTMKGYTQGYLTNSSYVNQFVSGSAIVSGVTFDRVNAVMRPLAENAHTTSSRHAYYFQDDCSLEPISYTLSEVYVNDEETGPQRREPDRLCRPSNDLGQSPCGGIGTWNTVFWPVSAQITGEVKKGLPGGGNYVDLNFTGLGYQSPGYRST